MAGCLIAAVTTFPLFGALTTTESGPRGLPGQDQDLGHGRSEQCNFHIFVGPCRSSRNATAQRRADQVRPVLHLAEGEPGKPIVIAVGDKKLEGFDAKEGAGKLAAALKEAGYSPTADKAK